MYTIQFYNNPYNYPDYGTINTIDGPISGVTGVDINDNEGMIRTDKLTYAQRYSVNYLSLERDGVLLYAHVIKIERRSGEKLVDIHFKVDAFRTFRSTVNFGTQLVLRAPTPTFDFDPLLRADTGETNDVTTTRYDFDNPTQRVLVVQLMRPDSDTSDYTTPVQPSPYIFYFKQYNMNSPQTDVDIMSLMKTITDSARPSNLASIYSVPVFASGGMSANVGALPLIIDGAVVNIGSTFFTLSGGSWSGAVTKYTDPFTFTDKSILKTDHAVSVVIPEAGIINIPDEILFKPNLRLRQDIDIYSGASNFMITYDDALVTPHSTRGGGLAAIPIAYDVQQQLLAANRTNIGTSIVGDVASIGMGVVGLATGKFTGGLGYAAGIGMITKGITGIVGTRGSIGDSVNQQVNPPAFMGSAMTANFNQSAFLVVTRARKDNETVVNQRYGYATNQVKTLTIPSSGYIQTQDCNVSGAIPNWARDEINNILNNGLRVI